MFYIYSVPKKSFRQFLTMKAAETLCIVSYHHRNIFPEENIWATDFQKNHTLFGFDHQICIFTDILKTVSMNFFQNSSLGSTPSALLIWLKKDCIIDLKIKLLAININMPHCFRHLCFFFGKVNNKWFHSNLPVQKTSTL